MKKIFGEIASIVLIMAMVIAGTSVSLGEDGLIENDFEPPVEDAQAYINQAQNAAANGAATFLMVEDYEPWAALVINAGNPMGVDMVTVSFEDGVLRIEATDSNTTNHASILINRAFADKYLADSEGDLNISTSDAVNYEGLDNSNASAGNSAVYVFRIEHFSTHYIEMSAVIGNDFDPPVAGGQAYMDQAQNAAAHGASTFLKVEGYEPWAALVINAGDPTGVDMVTVSFDDDVLRIEATDSNTTNYVTILINKAFADQHLADSEGSLDMSTSDAVNYEGMDNSNESAGNSAMYVFHIENFSTQWIEVTAESTPAPGFVWMLLAVAVPVVFFSIRRKKR